MLNVIMKSYNSVYFTCVVQISSHCELLLDTKCLKCYFIEDDRVPVQGMLFY